MEENFERFYSERAKSMIASEIRELLKLLVDPEMISFAGGVPNPDTFPTVELIDIISDLLKGRGSAMMQYGTTEGLLPLREELVKHMGYLGVKGLETDNIVITHGSQQGLDLSSKIFINSGDDVVTEAPTYLAALTPFKLFDARIHGIPLDSDGMSIDLLVDKLDELKKNGRKPKFIYVIPTYQNPSGITMIENRRRGLLEIAEDYDLIILEDNPYGEIGFDGNIKKPIKSFDTNGRVIYLGTFSKIFSPGLRIAWVAGPKEVISKMVLAKQATDLCVNTFGQHVISEYMARGHLYGHIEEIIPVYKKKAETTVRSFGEYMPDGVEWVEPKGGLFTWVTVPEGINTAGMLKKALKKKVAYVAGEAFYPKRDVKNKFRMSFSYPSEDRIIEGIKRLSSVIEGEIRGLEK